MKYTLSFLVIFLLWSGCQSGEVEDPNAIPEDLAGKKAFLKTKKAELRELNSLITKVEEEIEALTPDNQKSRAIVTTQPVDKEDFKRYVAIQASVESDDLVSASSEVGGRIVQLNVKEGSSVQKGQLIAKLDLEQIDKQIAELETALQLATDVYERQKRLWDQNIGSEIQFLEAENNKERLEKSLETLEFQKTKANVYAPISGVVEQEFMKQGELANPGMPIVQILNTAKVKVVADVPETYLGKVKKGELVTVKFPALNQERKARVSQLGRVIDPSNRTFKVEVNLNNSDRILKPNLLASMMINDFSAADVIAIPLEMVQQDISGKSFVFLKKKGETGAIAKKVFVKTGTSYEGKIIIEEGLAVGDELIMEGSRSVTDGELIKVQRGEMSGLTEDALK